MNEIIKMTDTDHILLDELLVLKRSTDGIRVDAPLDSTCVSVYCNNDSFILTPDFNTREKNLRDCIQFLKRMLKTGKLVYNILYTCPECKNVFKKCHIETVKRWEAEGHLTKAQLEEYDKCVVKEPAQSNCELTCTYFEEDGY